MKKIDKIFSNLFDICKDQDKCGNTKIIAAIYQKNHLVSYGFNSLKTCNIQRKFKDNEHKNFQHAETHAIKNAIKRVPISSLTKSTLFIARVKTIDDKDVWGLAKPCKGCQSCINFFGIKQTFYTLDYTEEEYYKELI